MPLAPGTRLGPYEIASRIGEGGMGEVWKARDTRLNRDVAIKTSAAKFSERFAREAQAIAALNHPHICQIYDVGPDYIVMELVDGVPVKGPLPLDQVLKLAIQLASAIEAAHVKNITHRDLKPANILLTKSGIKVLDFGLAKIEQTHEQAKAAVAGDETLTRALTQEGAIVGTLQYMAPEQLNGKLVDSRADLFSFGCVLYEMLTGKRSFDGATTASVIAGILEREPPSVEGVAPASLDWLLKRCLAKDPEDRWQTARDLRAALERISVIAVESINAAMNAPKRSRVPVLAWGAVAVLAVAAGSLAFVHFREKAAEAPLVRFSIQPQEGLPTQPTPPAVSPDGKMVAFAAVGGGKTQIWVRALDSLEARSLPGTENGTYPSWSPDSKSVAFISGGKVKKTDAAGGPVTVLADGGQVAAWAPDGVIVFSQSFSQGLKQVSANGGAVRDATRADSKVLAQRFPHILPDGKHFVYLASLSSDHAKLRVGTINTDGKAPGEDVELPDEVDSFAEYSQGSLLYVKGTTMMARPFDVNRLAWSGEAVPVAEEVRQGQTLQMMLFSASPGGVLVFQRGRNHVVPELLDRAGNRVASIGEAGDIMQLARFSPDGKTVGIVERDAGGVNLDIWMLDLARRVRTRFTFDPARDAAPVWSPDGRNVAFISSRGNSVGDLYVKPADGSSVEELAYADRRQKNPTSISRDGKFLAFTATGDGTRSGDIWILPEPLTPAKQRGDAAKPYPFLQTEFNEGGGQFSPDGRWIAYQSNESGNNEVYVTAFPGPGARKQVSIAGGANAHWRADAKELIYLATDNQVMAAEIGSNGATIEVGRVMPLFKLADGSSLQDLSADGQQLLVLARPDGETAQPLTVVTNWAAGLKK